MTFLAEFHFIRPGWLLLTPLVVGVWWLIRQSQDPLRGWRAVIDRKLLNSLTVGADTRGRWRAVGLLASWLLAIIAVAGPTYRPEPSPFADDPVPVMIVLKADQTMELTDLVPSRMERACLKVADFAEERKGLPLGLAAYAGTAHLVLPPTRDTSIIATMAAEISPSIMPKMGDDLGAALQLAADTLGSDRGSIVIVADTIAGNSINALSDFRARSRLPIHLLAVARAGTPEWQAIKQASSSSGVDATLMTADPQDVRALVRATARAPVAISAAGQGTRWAEAGWWLVPLLAMLSLASFRRFQNSTTREARP